MKGVCMGKKYNDTVKSSRYKDAVKRWKYPVEEMDCVMFGLY
jgi:hypothetical protein